MFWKPELHRLKVGNRLRMVVKILQTRLGKPLNENLGNEGKLTA